MRAFVIGNAISLRDHNLDFLINDVTFGMNNIHLRYPETHWRPTAWVCAEKTLQTASLDMYLNAIKTCKAVFINEHSFLLRDKALMPEVYPNIVVTPMCLDHECYMSETPPAWHLPVICRYGTSGTIAIQIAVDLGYNPIYVIGMDCNYSGNETTDWFDPKYNKPDVVHPTKARNLNVCQIKAHERAMIECQERGIEIYNAGKGDSKKNLPYKTREYEKLF